MNEHAGAGFEQWQKQQASNRQWQNKFLNEQKIYRKDQDPQVVYSELDLIPIYSKNHTLEKYTGPFTASNNHRISADEETTGNLNLRNHNIFPSLHAAPPSSHDNGRLSQLLLIVMIALMIAHNHKL